MLKNSVKIWLFQSQREGDAMAIRYAVDLTDTERAALREILSKNKAKRSTIMNAYILRNDARMPHCLRWGGMASLLGGLGDRFPQHDRDLPSKAPPLAAGIFTLTAPLLFFLVVALASSPLFSRCSEPRYAFLRC